MPSNEGYGRSQKSGSQGSNRGFVSMDEQKETASTDGEMTQAKSGNKECISHIGGQGGENSHGGSSEQHAKSGSQRHKNSYAEKDLDATWHRRSTAARTGSQSHKNK
ncbi:MAG: hypothetical protein ACREUM_09695 [Nitrosospira sp.]